MVRVHYLIVIFLFLIVAYIITRLNASSNKVELQLRALGQLNQKLQSKNKELTDAINYSHRVNGKELAEFIDSFDGVKDMKPPKLVFRFNDISCNSCVEDQISLLKKYSTELGAANVVLFTKFETARDLHVFKKTQKIDFEIYNIKDFSLIEQEYSSPFYFILNQQRELAHFFSPLNDDHGITETYFKMMKSIYFCNEGQTK